jgi:hypothetical protein
VFYHSDNLIGVLQLLINLSGDHITARLQDLTRSFHDGRTCHPSARSQHVSICVMLCGKAYVNNNKLSNLVIGAARHCSAETDHR